MAKIYGICLMAAIISLGGFGCNDASFSAANKASGKKNSEDSNPPGGPGGPGVDTTTPGLETPTNPDGGLGGDSGSSQKPQVCNSSNIKIIEGSMQCPEHSAIYALDDAKSLKAACCPLPALDILAKDGTAARSECNGDEIGVGVQGNLISCKKINLAKYKMSSDSTATCYYGSGASGGSGAQNCSAPPSTMVEMTKTFGTDSCLPQPWGAMVIKYQDKQCASAKSRRLLYIDGSNVETFKSN